MDKAAGLEGAYFEEVFFTEDPAPTMRLDTSPISVEISRQNANLSEVKRRMVAKVRARGGNAVVGFTYGQKSHSVAAQLFTFKWDSESWHGSGYIAMIDPH